MILLEQPYTSPETAAYLAETGTPVLDNAAARSVPGHARFNLVRDAECARMIDRGDRLYTTSEGALEWVYANVRDPAITAGVTAMKDKFRLRSALRVMYPEYYFREVAADDLAALDPADLPLPLVLKPVIGFFSVGVYAIRDADDWRAALADIAVKRDLWRQQYAAGVVGDGRFILEQFIEGDEYAIDAYYDRDGEPVVVNILKHEFSSAADVSDRLYYTSAATIRDNLAAFTAFLGRAGAILGLKNFPIHVEVRVSEKGIVPIEFNPLRFAGWCTTELSLFAYGYRTYDYYLHNRRPDWDALLRGCDRDLYSFVILDRPEGASGKVFDFAAAEASFTEVLNRRPVSFPDSPVYGFLFVRTPADNRSELDRILRSDLREFLID